MLDSIRPGRRLDVTDGVECYENGKTFECECGQGFGVEFGVRSVVCPSCSLVLVDENVGSRGPPEENAQTDLEQWT